MTNITTDSLAATTMSAYNNHKIRGTSKKIIIVEGPTDVRWLKSVCDDNRYEIIAQAGKDRVLDYALNHDNDAHSCYVIDVDLDYLKNEYQHTNTKIVYNCMPISDSHINTEITHFNDIEIFQINSRTFESIFYDVDYKLSSTDINKVRNKLEVASNTYGRFYAAYELLDLSTSKRSFIKHINAISDQFFDSRKLTYDVTKFSRYVYDWIKRTHEQGSTFAQNVMDKAYKLKEDYPQPWIFSRGHTAVELFTSYMMRNYPNKFNANLEFAMDDIIRNLNKIAASEVKKLPLSQYVQLRD